PRSAAGSCPWPTTGYRSWPLRLASPRKSTGRRRGASSTSRCRRPVRARRSRPRPSTRGRSCGPRATRPKVSVGGALALDAAWLLGAFLVILTLAAVGIAARRFLLERGGGTVECGFLRRPTPRGGGA